MFTRLLLVLCLAAASLSAEAPGCTTAHVPFAFEANNVTMASGQYTFCPKTNSKAYSVSPEGAWGILDLVNIVKVPDRAADPEWVVVFNRYGDRYFLHQVRTPLAWAEFSKSKRERALVTSTFITAVKVAIPARPR